MQREIYEDLLKWKGDKDRKPLVVEGARQVGKTYIIKEFGNKNYDNIAYFNFDNNDRLKNIFNADLNIERILLLLSAEVGYKINENTLIFFDEIQECEKAVTSLKYFCEEKREFNVIVAGSLLGLSYKSGTGFPVGKVNFLKMYPMTFREFLLANNEKLIVDLIKNKEYDIIKTLRSKIDLYFRIYNFVGGMPEVVKNYVENKNFNKVKQIQTELLKSYDKDFAKYADKNKLDKVRMIFNAIPSELAKDNKKFSYSNIKKGARASDFEYAIEFLKEAGLIYVIQNVSKLQETLQAYANSKQKKIYLLDCGLLSNMNHINEKSINDTNYVFEEFKGQMAETYVLCQLMPKYNNIFYYRNDSGRLEVDYLIEIENKVCPIEVKSGINLRAKSLNNIIAKNNIKYAIRYSLADHKKNEVIEDIPLVVI